MHDSLWGRKNIFENINTEQWCLDWKEVTKTEATDKLKGGHST